MKRYFLLFLTYCLAVFCWLGIVPLIACRVHRMVFEGNVLNSFSNLYSLNVTSIVMLFTPEHVAIDIMRGSAIVAVFLCTFILLVFLREQIVNGGPPELFNLENAPEADPQEPQVEDNRIQEQLNRLNLELEDMRGHVAAGLANMNERIHQFREQGIEVDVPEHLRDLINLDVDALTEQLRNGAVNRNLAHDLRSINNVLETHNQQEGQNEHNDTSSDQEVNGNLGDLEEERNNIAHLIDTVRNVIDHDTEPREDLRELMNMDADRLTDYIREGRNDNRNLNNLIQMMDHNEEGDQDDDGQGNDEEGQDEQDNPQVIAEQQQDGGNAEEGDNWGRDVERIVEDLTWQRLFGLDGSLVFIEHVIWMISLNIIFIIVWSEFLFCFKINYMCFQCFSLVNLENSFFIWQIFGRKECTLKQ